MDLDWRNSKLKLFFRDYDVGNSVFHATSFYWITANFMLIFGFIKGACRVFARSLEPEPTFRAIEKYKVLPELSFDIRR
jgi:hypothetical protein